MHLLCLKYLYVYNKIRINFVALIVVNQYSMARLDSKGHLKGGIGPVSYHSYNGNVYIQAKPGRGYVKQTAATKKSASDFGRASSLARVIRASLFPILQNHSDNSFYRRFAAKVHIAAQDGNPQPKGSRSLINGNLSLLDHTDCNTSSPFTSYCSPAAEISLSGSRELSIALPEFQVLNHITVLREASHAELLYLVTVINPETNSVGHSELFRVELPLRDTLIPQQQFLTPALPEAHIIVVASAVFYYRNNNLAGMVGLNGKGFHPCEVTKVLR
jgi:hypothetical protein